MRRSELSLMSDAIAEIWQAAGDPSLWTRAMGAVKPLIPESIGFATFTPFTEGPGVIWQTMDPPPGFMDEYMAHWLGRDATIHTLARRLPAEQLIIDHYTAPEFERCDVWQQLYLPHGIRDMSLLATNGVDDGGTYALLFAGFVDSQDAKRAERRRRLLSALAPHFGGSARLHWRLVRAESQSASSKSILDRLSLGIAVLSAQGIVLDMNRAARRLLDRRDGLVFGHGKIAATDVEAQRRLDRAIAAVLAGGAERPVSIPREKGAPLTIIIAPAVVDQSQLTGSSARAILFISDPNLVPENAGARIGSLYGLTRAEAEVAERIAIGMDAAEIAKARGTSIATARTQLKTLMAKIGASRQSDVVRSVLAISVLDPR